MRARFALLLAALLAACAPMPQHMADPPAPAEYVVYGLVNEWHTELSLPAKPLTGQLTRFRSIFPDAAYFSFGFGERLYFQKEHTDFLDKLRAILPGPGTLLVTALAGPPPQMYPGQEIVAMHLTQAQLDRLADYMWESLEKTPNDQLVRLGEGKFPGYVFYGSSVNYNGFFTCNTWTIEALDAAGLEAGAPGVLFAYQAMNRIRAIAAQRPGT